MNYTDLVLSRNDVEAPADALLVCGLGAGAYVLLSLVPHIFD